MGRRTSNFSLVVFLLCVTAIIVFLGEPGLDIFSQHGLQEEEGDLCACGKCSAEDDVWFTSRFRRAVEPFLSARLNLSEDAFDWWKLIQIEKRSFTTYRETVRSLFQIFPPSPHFMEPRSEQCRTCAVVGNSINLKGSRYGALIDAHDVVIRINQGQTKGYEADVGNRSTHRVMYPESSVDLDNTTHLVLFPFKLKDIEWLLRTYTSTALGTKYKSINSTVRGNMDLVTVLNPAFMKYVHETWLDSRGAYPSTGFMTVVLALHVCGEVDVFGFGADEDGNWSHYWERLQDRTLRTGVHPGTYEHAVIQKLAKKHKISFYPGRCDVRLRPRPCSSRARMGLKFLEASVIPS